MISHTTHDRRYVAHENPEPDCPAAMFLVEVFDPAGELIESFTSDDAGYRDAEAYAETQDLTFEERYAPFGPAFEREAEARRAG